jgi:hypothetical protein
MLAPLRRHSQFTRIPDEKIFCKDAVWINTRLRRRVLQLGFMPYSCALCENPGFHFGRPLVLHLDHENGDHSDCRKENLRWLCPNCHSQTPTYARSSLRKKDFVKLTCPACSGTFERRASKSNDKIQYCSQKCSSKAPRTRHVKVDRAEVMRLFSETGNRSEVARRLGVSDVLIGKILRSKEM